MLEAKPETSKRGAFLRNTPRLGKEAFALVWRAAPRTLVSMTTLQLLAGFGLAVQLLIARRIMNELVAVSQGAPASALYAPFMVLIVISAVLGLMTAVGTFQQRLLVDLVGRYAYDQVIAVSAAIDYTAFETPDFHDRLQRAKTSGQLRMVDMVSGLTAFIAALATTVWLVVLVALLEPLLVGLVLLAAVPALLAALHNSRKSYEFEYAMTSESRERAYLVDLLTSREPAKEVRLFDLGDHLRRRYQALTEERIRQLRLFLRQRLGVTVVSTVAGALGTALALASLVVFLDTGRIGVATAVTAGLAMQQLAARLTTMTGSVGRLIESGMFIDDYTSFVELGRSLDASPLASPEIAANGRPASPADRRPRRAGFDALVVDRVSFAYPASGKLVLDDVSVEVEPGEVVALVGENGSGKTTLVKLICQLYQPRSGRVLWNGLDAALLDVAEIRSSLTVLFQDFAQYHLSALDNIRFGRVQETAASERAIAAAREAGAHDFLSRLPGGYKTRLGLQFDGGHELSVGQWQRLALARAFFRGGGFLILDEPTASLDPRAERDLFAQMRRLSAGRSVLLISHRFSSVRSADRIYVLESGQIAESGTHDELMVQRGQYAELFELQAAAYLGGIEDHA